MVAEKLGTRDGSTEFQNDEKSKRQSGKCFVHSEILSKRADAIREFASCSAGLFLDNKAHTEFSDGGFNSLSRSQKKEAGKSFPASVVGSG